MSRVVVMNLGGLVRNAGFGPGTDLLAEAMPNKNLSAMSWHVARTEGWDKPCTMSKTLHLQPALGGLSWGCSVFGGRLREIRDRNLGKFSEQFGILVC